MRPCLRGLNRRQHWRLEFGEAIDDGDVYALPISTELEKPEIAVIVG